MVFGVDYMTSEMEAGLNFSAEHNLAVKEGKSDWPGFNRPVHWCCIATQR